DPDKLLRGAELREADGGPPMLERGLVGEYIAASLADDADEAERRADLAAEQALLAVDPPQVARDIDLAMTLAHAAITALRPTLAAKSALYRAWAEGNRGTLKGHYTDPSFIIPLTAVAWAPDGTRLATGTERTWHDYGDHEDIIIDPGMVQIWTVD